MVRLPDLSVLQYPGGDDGEGPMPCFAVVYQLGAGKTLKARSKARFMGALRHKKPLLCTMGALAQYFFHRWHIAGEMPPNFQRREDWYDIVLLAGKDPSSKPRTI